MILDKLVPDLHHRHGIPQKSIEIKIFSQRLQTLFNERYTQSLSYLQQYRIRKDIKLVHSIRRKLRQTNAMICVTDKSCVFDIGSTFDYDIKVKEYQIKTNGYIKLSSDPLMDTFYKVVRLLNDLRSKKQITQWQQTKMMPDKNKLKIAYLYFIPKPYKVIVLIIILPFFVCELTLYSNL